jgi:hypothetical protein
MTWGLHSQRVRYCPAPSRHIDASVGKVLAQVGIPLGTSVGLLVGSAICLAPRSASSRRRSGDRLRRWRPSRQDHCEGPLRAEPSAWEVVYAIIAATCLPSLPSGTAVSLAGAR